MTDYDCPDLECTEIFTSAGEGLIQNSADPLYNNNIDAAAKKVFKVVESYKAGEYNGKTIKYLKGSGTRSFGDNVYTMFLANGAMVSIQNFGCGNVPNQEGSLKKLCAFITVDTNGDKLPNAMGKDIFSLGGLYNDGRIVPNTSLIWAQSKVGIDAGKNYSLYWRNYPEACGKPNVKLRNDPTPSILGQDCFARVLENNFELDYLK